MLLISPTEPSRIKALGTTSSKPERYGADILWFAHGQKYGIQRKQFPDDFMASLHHDGRLEREVGQMQSLDASFLLVEGFGVWTTKAQLLESPFSKSQMFAMFASLALRFGIVPIRVKDMDETILAIKALVEWSKKEAHKSLMVRPGPKPDKWGQKTSKVWGIHVLKGFETIGPGKAESMWDHFKGLPLRWDVEGPEELAKIKGIGKKTAERLWETLQ